MQAPESLVLSGGGVKGIAFFGVLKALHETLGWDFGRKRPALKNIFGVSIGCFLGLLVALGFSVDELLSTVRFLDFSTMMGPNPAAILGGGMIGLDDGSALQSKLEHFLMERLGRKDLTLKDLREATGVSFMVGAVDLEKAQFVSLGPDSHPDLSVCSAIRASMAIPPLFPPMRFPDGRLFADGGILNNFPITQFPAESVLGLRLTSSKIAAVNPSSLSSYFSRIVGLLTSPIDEAQWACVPSAYRQRTITILIGGMSALDVGVASDLAVRVSLVAMGMEYGREAAEAWAHGRAPRESALPSGWLEAVPEPLQQLASKGWD